MLYRGNYLIKFTPMNNFFPFVYRHSIIVYLSRGNYKCSPLVWWEERDCRWRIERKKGFELRISPTHATAAMHYNYYVYTAYHSRITIVVCNSFHYIPFRHYAVYYMYVYTNIPFATVALPYIVVCNSYHYHYCLPVPLCSSGCSSGTIVNQ